MNDFLSATSAREMSKKNLWRADVFKQIENKIKEAAYDGKTCVGIKLPSEEKPFLDIFRKAGYRVLPNGDYYSHKYIISWDDESRCLGIDSCALCKRGKGAIVIGGDNGLEQRFTPYYCSYTHEPVFEHETRCKYDKS